MTKQQDYFYINKEKARLLDIGKHIYDMPDTWINERFVELNRHILHGDTVEAGQVLYLPPKTGLLNQEKADIQKALTDIEKIRSEFESLHINAKVPFEDYIQFLSFVLDYSSRLPSVYGSVYSYRIRHVTYILESLEREFLASMKRNHGKLDAHFYDIRRSKFSELDFALGNLVREVVIANPDRNLRMKNQLGISWKSEILEWHRSEGGKNHISNFVPYYEKLQNLGKMMKYMGYLGLGLEASATALNIHEACQAGDRRTCQYARTTKLSGFAGGVAGAMLGEKASGIALKYGVCNLLLDVETAGAGIVICGIAVSAAGSAAVGATVNRLATSGSSILFNNLYKVGKHD